MNTQSYQSINRQALWLMVFACLVWGGQQVALKAAANDMAPILQIATRSFIAGLVLLLLMLFKKENYLDHIQSWKAGIVAGLLFGVEYLLVGEGLRYTTASHMVVFLYTAPIFAAIGLPFFIPAEKLNTIQWCGIGAAFLGIVVIFFKTDASANPHMLWGDLLGLCGGITWAATTIVVRTTSLARCPANLTLLYQLCGAFILLFPVSLFTSHTPINWSPVLWFSLFYQTFIVCLVSFILWFWLLKRYLASMLGVLSFMTPVFGVIMGVLFLHDALTLRFVLGSVLAMIGLVIVTGYNGISLWYRKHKMNSASPL